MADDAEVPSCYVLTSVLSRADEQREEPLLRWSVQRRYKRPLIVGIGTGLLLTLISWRFGIIEAFSDVQIRIPRVRFMLSGTVLSLLLLLGLPVAIAVSFVIARTRSGATLGEHARTAARSFGQIGMWHVGITPVVPDPTHVNYRVAAVPVPTDSQDGRRPRP